MSIEFTAKVESYDVQPNGNIKISSLLKILQKAAGDDVNRTSLDYFTLAGHNIAFVLTKMSLKILSDIKIYDELAVISHPRKVRGVSFPRDFIIKIGEKTAAVASSMWVLIDLEKRSILRPSAIDSIGHLPPSDDDLFELEDVRRIVDVNSLLRTDVREVKYSFLDMNNHLNNTFYSDFLFDTIDPKLHESDVGMYLQINYKNEARIHDKLVISSLYNAESCEYDFSAHNEENGKVCFNAYLKFEK